tara:strand:- start:939 stop:1040 length:102 start_codon:yes stop_codon:yes gene_type:complete
MIITNLRTTYDREKAIERLELAKEKDSIENKKG